MNKLHPEKSGHAWKEADRSFFLSHESLFSTGSTVLAPGRESGNTTVLFGHA